MKIRRQSLLFQTPEGRQKSPDALFAEFEQLLVSNSGEDAFDVGIKLLAAKLEDELSTPTGARRFTLSTSIAETHAAVEDLLRGASQRWPGAIEFNGGLKLTPEQLTRCMRPLVGWDVLGAGLVHLDPLLERLVARGAKGALGQYFTPRNVIRMCVSVLNPTGGERVIDPACGSAGFLLEAITHSIRQEAPPPRCLGMDFGARALKVASLLAAAAPDGAIRISDCNSIDGRAWVGRRAADEWSGFTANEPTEMRPWGPWHDLRAEVVLTNPPFAGTVDEIDVLKAYDSQREDRAGRRGAVGREHLFLERVVSLLDERGRLAIVLPQGLLANTSAAYLRSWLGQRCRILGVVGLHPHAFLPHTGVKTSVLFLSKERPPKEYPVFFATSRHPGKDSSGRPSVSDDYTQVANAFRSFLVDQGFSWANRGGPHGEAACAVVPYSEVLASNRFDAEYHDPELRLLDAALIHEAARTVGSRVARSISRFKRIPGAEIDYIDISSVDARTGIPLPTRIDAVEAPSRASYEVLPGDILVSTVRPDRNTVALVGTETDRTAVASNGFCVLRPHGVSSELLFAFCKSNAFRRLLARHATASMYPAVTDRDVLDLPLALPVGDIAQSIETRVRSALTQMENAKRRLEEAVQAMDLYLDGVANKPLVDGQHTQSVKLPSRNASKR